MRGRAPQSPPCSEGSVDAQTLGESSPLAPSSAVPPALPPTGGAPLGRFAGLPHTALLTIVGHAIGVLPPTDVHTDGHKEGHTPTDHHTQHLPITGHTYVRSCVVCTHSLPPPGMVLVGSLVCPSIAYLVSEVAGIAPCPSLGERGEKRGEEGGRGEERGGEGRRGEEEGRRGERGEKRGGEGRRGEGGEKRGGEGRGGEERGGEGREGRRGEGRGGEGRRGEGRGGECLGRWPCM